MRPALKWTFGLSAGASAIALLWPIDEDRSLDVLPPPLEMFRPESPTGEFFPEVLPAQLLLPTKKDPFASIAVAKPVVAPPPVPLPVAPPEPPRAPPLTYRYLGSFTNPQGSREIYLSNANQTISVRQGAQLDGGYTVDAITATTIKVLHGATQTRVDIPIVQSKESP